MFHHCNDPIRFGHFEHLKLPRCCIVTWHLLAVNRRLVKNFEPSSEYSLWCWQQRKIVSEYSQLACEWFLPSQEIRLQADFLLWQKSLAANICRQFFFVITAAASARNLVESFQLICYSQQVNATSQYNDSGSSRCFKMAERSDSCSGEKLLAPCTRKKTLQRKMTKDYHCIGVQDNIGMLSKS